MRPVQPADRAARRRAVAVAAVAVVAVAAAIAIGDRWLAGVLAQAPGEARRSLAGGLRWVAVLASLPIAVFAVYLLWLGRRITRTLRFPPPGLAVLRDTPILEGTRARARGILVQALAVVLFAAALLLTLVTFRLAAVLG